MKTILLLIGLGFVTFVLCGEASRLPVARGDEPEKTDSNARLKERDRLWKEAQELIRKGKIAEAITAAEKVTAIDKEVHGEMHASTLGSLQFLGKLYWQAGKFEEADRCLRDVSAGWEKLYPKTHPDHVLNLIDLGRLQTEMGKAPRSESFFRRAFQIKNEEGKKDALHADAARAFGLHCLNKGEFARAAPLLKAALAIRAECLGKKHLDYAHSLNDLHALYVRTGQFDVAKQLLEEAVEIFKSNLGEFHPIYASMLGNEGVLYHYTGDLARAKDLFQRALEINKKVLGEQHPALAAGLLSLGQLASSQGRYGEAEERLQQAKALFVKTRNGGGRSLVVTLSALAEVYAATDRLSEAIKFQLQALELEQEDIRQIFSFSTEQGMFDFFATIRGRLEALDSLAIDPQQTDPSAPSAALTWTLRRKGIIVQTLCQFRQKEQELLDQPFVQQSTKNLLRLRKLLAAAETDVRRTSDPDVQERKEKWTASSEEIERELHRAVAAFQPKQTQFFHWTDAEQVREKLAANSALIEMVRVRLKVFKATGKEPLWKPEHYLAFVLTHEKNTSVRLVDLGPAERIDNAVRGFREKIQQAPRELRAADEKTVEEDFRIVSGALYEMLFAPLRPALGKATLIYLAPDSEVNRIPFEALVDSDAKYLVENFRFAYLSTGRDLLRPRAMPPMPKAGPSPAPRVPQSLRNRSLGPGGGRGTVVFAGPDYDLKADARQAKAINLLGMNRMGPAVALRGGPTPDTRGLRWRPLPGAAAEAEDVKKALYGSRYGPIKAYVGKDALEDVFKALPPPCILHIATHGFFLPDQSVEKNPEKPVTASQERGGAAEGLARLRKMQNPLVRSGIVLAGANALGEDAPESSVEDGWVTAEEIALMNLRGTELVVLSACETGLGDVRIGEGVYGLRHAFLYAGARSLVTSLFEVPDAETRAMMKRFYESLNGGRGKLDALHDAQLDMIRQRRKEKEAAHPFFWASFVLVGEPN